MSPWFRAGIFRRILLYILAVSLVPLLLLGTLTLYSTNQAGYTAIDRSREALDTKSAEALELRAAETAQAIADFLRERETDVRAMALLPRTPEAYMAFYRDHQGELWFLEGGTQVHRTVPLYREVAYVDAAGREVLKVVDGRVADAGELYDVSNPINTRYRSETYFAQAKGLLPGEVFVSHVTGSYVSKPQFDAGERFAGVLRLAQPVFDPHGEFEGVVVLALDSRHLEEFTTHIVPTKERLVVASDATTGNYAYLIDDEGFPVAHPLDYHQRGLDGEGQWVPYAQGPEDLGTRPLRLDRLGFADENIPYINAQALQGHAGSIQYQWEGRDKFVAYAPVPYYGSPYAPPGGFGWVAIGAEVATFHEAAALVGETLQRTVQTLATGALVIVILTGAIVLLAAGILARQISRPIQQLTGAVGAVGQGDLEIARAISGGIRTRDELGILANGVANMVDSLKRRDVELQTIHQISQDITANLEMDRTLQTVLEQIREIVPYQRGEIYLYDEAQGVLCAGARSTPAWIPADGQERKVSLGEGNTGWIAEHRQSLHIPGEKGFLGVPLLANQKLVGTLELCGNLDEHDRRLLETIAPPAAIAIENARQVIERERDLREQIEQLQIEIDRVKQARQVAEITETEYFRQLQARARELRKQGE